MLKKQILQYKIISLLGEGGMAKVYLAHDAKFDTNVAMKLLNKEYTNNENIRKRFLAEARSMYRMSHSNIIKVTDLIDDGDTVAFVMEYVEGVTLKDFIDRKGKLSDEEIQSIFVQMVEAVGYVHKQNLVHRDIKPSNFMVDPEGKVKLMDFGIAKNTDANSAEYTQTGTGIQMGTPMYMSPEQVKSTKEVTFASDIYSLGVVLWQMVAGEKPYDSSELSVPEIQVSILRETLPILNTLWDAIIAKSTAKNVEERFESCDIIFKLIHSQKNREEDNEFLEKTIVTNPVINDNQGLTKYPSVKIGNQVWMTENLNVSKFRNGDVIPEAKTDEEWAKAGERGLPAWSYYENKTENGEKYGKLYNWFAVNDPRGLAPLGYHLPNLNDLVLLIDFLDGERIAGLKLKSGKGWNEKWLYFNGNGTNESGFNGLPGGSRSDLGIYIGENFYSGWWLTNELNKQSSISPFYFYLFNDSNRVMNANSHVEQGFYVRCLKDN